MAAEIRTNDIEQIKALVKQLRLPAPTSHKGQNGKLLVIGGSELFHASFIWSAETASRFVDMVHLSSPAEVNNRLIRERLKSQFLNGIVAPWNRIQEYIEEDDCILIGPGMPRNEGLEDGERPTADIINEFLTAYPQKKWVIDGGALQEVQPALLNGQMIVTPHQKEWERLIGKDKQAADRAGDKQTQVKEFSLRHGGVTVLLKGPTDVVARGDELTLIEGGNAGMTKGGTGDVLAGMTAALATTNDNYLAAQIASVINKYAGDRLYERAGTHFNATDLSAEIPQALREILR